MSVNDHSVIPGGACKKRMRVWVRLTLSAGLWMPLSAQLSVSVSPSISSPAPLGTVVTWTANVRNVGSGTLSYRFRSRSVSPRFQPPAGRKPLLAVKSSEYRTLVDYGPSAELEWSVIDHEGFYQIEVSVRNHDTGETASSSALFWLTPLSDGVPVVTPTSHPLVVIYSAPPCPAGARMQVQWQSPDGFVQNTNYKACDPRFTMNFYLAGMRSGMPYTAHHVIDAGDSQWSSSETAFISGTTTRQPPVEVALTSNPMPSADGVLLQSLLQNNSIATDLSGNILWYGPPGISFLTRPVPGGTFLGTIEDGTKDASHQFVREFDLVGHTVAETNAARVNEQLATMGFHPINSFHHEARKLPDGKYLVLADSERILTDMQGPGAVDVIGDTILVLDANLQVTWVWDSFDHLDPHRIAVLGETCTYPANLACAPFYLSAHANDWLHGNSLQLAPDGNILYSMRHQDWVIKIGYQNGAGTGAVLWRLGQDGDFQILSTDPQPWFSHQHDANFASDNATMLVFDDGNTRAATDPAAHSRGQVLRIDEANRVATLTLNADLGGYSYALGSAQQLPNGDFHFDAGASAMPDQTGSIVAQSLEVDPSGSIVYGIQFATYEYRSFRMPDLYTEP
jgi:arylsulfate sulfotransferase